MIRKLKSGEYRLGRKRVLTQAKGELRKLFHRTGS